MNDTLNCGLPFSGQCSIQIYEKTIDTLNFGIVILSSDGTVMLWNHWMEEKSGLKKSEVYGKSLKNLFPEVDNPRLFSAIQHAIEKGNAAILAQSIHHSPLPLFDIHKQRLAQAVEIHPIRTWSDSGYHCLIQITDVSSAVRREQQLRDYAEELSQLIEGLSESESRAHAILENSGDGIVTINDSGLVESLNASAAEIFHCREEEVLQKPVVDFFPPAYAEQIPALIRRLCRHPGLMQTGVWQLLEAKRSDGEMFPVQLNLTVVKQKGQNRIIGIIRDMSEIEASESALIESKENLEMALDSADLVIWNWDIETGEVRNEKLFRFLGYSECPETFEVSDWVNLVHPDDWPEVNMRMRMHLDGYSSRFECEYRLLRSTGEWMWVHDQGKVIARNKKGDALRIIGVNQNITQKKLAEIEASKASEKALEAAKAKSNFLANMSHELKTPMNGIMGVLNILKQSDPTEEQREYIEVAQRSAESLLKLIDNVLEFTRLGAQSVQLEILEFDPEEIIKDVVKLLSESAQQKNIRFSYQMEDETLDSIVTDPGRLRQVLINLAGNALKFTEDGFVEIRMSRLDRKTLLFEVEDSGIGIPKDRQEVIFEAFTQADVSTTRKFGGTGLGLGISRELVELMGGQIRVESIPGKGSTFSFTIRDQKEMTNHPLENEREHA